MAKKKNTVVIKTLEDMVDLVNHNCEHFDRSIRKLQRSRGWSKAFGLFTIGAVVYTAVKCRQQEEELYKLSIKVNKLENKEGE